MDSGVKGVVGGLYQDTKKEGYSVVGETGHVFAGSVVHEVELEGLDQVMMVLFQENEIIGVFEHIIVVVPDVRVKLSHL